VLLVSSAESTFYFIRVQAMVAGILDPQTVPLGARLASSHQVVALVEVVLERLVRIIPRAEGSQTAADLFGPARRSVRKERGKS